MPLPAAVDREQLHLRSIELRGYRRADGLFDIEGRITDVKSHPLHTPGNDAPLPAGVPIHDMSVRLVIDEELRIIDVIAVTDAGPYGDCPAAAGALATLRGAQIGRGWTTKVKALIGPESCTHLVELLIPMATVAYQTLAPERFARVDTLDAAGRPTKIDSCYAYASQRELVLKRWPAQYTGPNTVRQAAAE